MKTFLLHFRRQTGNFFCPFSACNRPYVCFCTLPPLATRKERPADAERVSCKNLVVVLLAVCFFVCCPLAARGWVQRPYVTFQLRTPYAGVAVVIVAYFKLACSPLTVATLRTVTVRQQVPPCDAFHCGESPRTDSRQGAFVQLLGCA
jgi:hypothetical protein